MMRGAWTGNTRYKGEGGGEGGKQPSKSNRVKEVRKRETVNFKRELSESAKSRRGAFVPFPRPENREFIAPLFGTSVTLHSPPPALRPAHQAGGRGGDGDPTPGPPRVAAEIPAV